MRRALALLAILLPPAAAAQTPFDNLKFRSIGPAALGGRIHDVEGVPGDPFTLYVATASGGLWKTTNKGTTWTPIFENQAVATFGDVALFAGNPDILFVGTGEQNNRQSTSWGNGVYKSTDAGKTWTHLGLAPTRHIARVAIHPTNADIAYVAAAGNLWAPSPDRGVYKTSDGGRTWSKVLYVDTLTGATDIVINASDPNVIVAATYQRMRTPSGFNGGGPGSGIHKSTDGGATWRNITAGVPAGDKGRIGLAMAKTNPRILIALIEHQTESGTYRSEDGGDTWTRVNRLNPRPMYYSKPVIDPTNADRVWVPGVTVYRSDDGGRNFRTLPTGPTYDVGLKGDHHAFWINPKDSRHVYLGGDGGLHESWDLGETWVRMNNLPIGQFYAVAADDRDPYWVYGGMQDNHSWMGPSATRHWLGIVNEDWRQIGFGDGMYQRPDPFNKRWVYTASQNLGMQRFDIETGDRLGLKPFPPAEGDTAYRFDWTAPIVVSKHAPGTVYVGGNRLFITRDYGNSWTRTKDLTRQVNRDTIPVMGVLGRNITLSRNDGESSFSELTSISESPIDPRVLWIGTDDGLVQVSRDGGLTWSNVTAAVPEVPAGTLVSRIHASALGRGAAYASFDGHRSGDLTPYLFRTTDFGRSWTRVSGNLPPDMPVRTVHEFPAKPGVVFAGLEFALYMSIDSARTWSRVSTLPTTRYDDVLVHPRTRDIIVGTHGRSIWILDDAGPIAEWSPAMANRRVHLFAVRDATVFQYWQDFSYRAHGAYAGDNPPDGALISYYLGHAPAKVTITVKAPDGRQVRTLDGPRGAGTIQRVSWDLRHQPPPGGAVGPGGEEGGARDALPRPPRAIDDRGPFVSPGVYTVTVDADGQTMSRTVNVKQDPMLPLTAAQHRQRESFLLDVSDAQRTATSLGDRMTALRRQLTSRREAASQGSAARQSADDALARLTTLERQVRAGPGAVRGRVYGLASEFNGNGAQQGSLYPPTKTHRQQFAIMRAILLRAQTALAALEALSSSIQE
ncbi:MAG: WD40/YVTN/BNR-like repeat-containing protein [Gemmatimonadaceae bacterium]